MRHAFDPFSQEIKAIETYGTFPTCSQLAIARFGHLPFRVRRAADACMKAIIKAKIGIGELIFHKCSK